MPGIYDIAAGIRPPETATALATARNNRAQRRLTEAQAILTEQNVANDERDYKLEERKVAVGEGNVLNDAAETQRKYLEWRDKMMTGQTEDQRRAFQSYEDLQEHGANLYDKLIEAEVPPEDATRAVSAIFETLNPQMPANLKGRAYDHRLGSAVRASRSSNAGNGKTSFQRVVALPGQEPKEMEVFRDASGMYITDQNKGRIDITSDMVSTPTARSQVGELRPAEAEELRAAQYNTQNYIDTVADAIEMIESTPDANTAVARMAGIVNDLQKEALAFADQFGVDIEPGSLEIGTYADTFDGLGITNGRMKSLVVNLAFQKALASQQAGRDVSNADVQRFMLEIGANHADPRAFKAVLVDTAKRMDRNFRNRHKVLLQKEFEGSFGLERFGAGATGPRTEVINGVTVEFLD